MAQMYVESSCPLIALLRTMECTQDNSRPSASLPGKKDVRTQELVTDQRGMAFRNQAPMKLGKHRLNTCHAHIAKCFITPAGIIRILDTEAGLGWP